MKKKIERGIAFPTCLSVNNTVCHFSPLATDDAVLEENDMVKMYCIAATFSTCFLLFFYFTMTLDDSALIYRDMGCHIDGFIAVVAHTHVIKDGPVTGRAADVLAAANTAAEVAMRIVRPGKKVRLLQNTTVFLLILFSYTSFLVLLHVCR